jgi:hypothetical protein
MCVFLIKNCIQDVSLCQSIGPGLCEARYFQIIWVHLRLKLFNYISVNQLDNWNYGVDCTCYKKSILSNFFFEGKDKSFINQHKGT